MEILEFFLVFFIGVDINADPVLLEAHIKVTPIYFLFFLMIFYFNWSIIWYFFSVKSERKIFFLRNQAMMDFCINFSVALGVMGTLLSIGVAFASASGDISQTIGSYFGTALLTTVVGIILYGYFFVFQAAISFMEYGSFK